ncbi:MAG TPA: TetR/AcrR family transcriptional regulator [Candidatus Acidoferrales bacterium]|jgi:AcrR family transcriptional regulator|nr:TetR/AcrR family transcriptional regulator [Candidatus Acidoferrales bacterium]
MIRPSRARRTADKPTPHERPGRRERRGAETREKIFRAALELFGKRGFQATTVEDITEAADVGKGTFFNYFPTKEHILAAFGQIQRAKIEQASTVAREGREPMRNVLRGMVRALSEEPGRSPAFFRSVLSAMLSSEAVRDRVTQDIELGRQRLEELLAIGQQRGEIRSDRPASELSRLVQRSCFGTMLFWSLRPMAPLAEQMDASVDLFWSGIAAGPEASLKEKQP